MIAWPFVIGGVLVMLIGFMVAETAYYDGGWKFVGMLGVASVVFGLFWGAIAEGWFV